MFLKDLIEILEKKNASGPELKEISSVSYDSREVVPNSIFVAIPGTKYDGAEFIDSAIKRGAAAVVAERDVDVPGHVAKVIVPSARKALATLSTKLNNFPSRRLKVIGVTGTNGKTTICYLLEAIFKAAGFKVGTIGTVDATIGDKVFPTKLTTPESADLQKLFSEMVKEHVDYVVMEVSSHALAQGRVMGTEFDAAIYTNLTHDHLDFHGNMEEYLKAKLELFKMLGQGKKKERYKIVNADDEYSKKIISTGPGKVVTYGLHDAEVTARNVATDIDHSSFILSLLDGQISVKTSLPGQFNVYNILAAAACAEAFGVSKEAISKALEGLKVIPGRFERVDAGQKFPVIVDFAHSPDSLEKMLDTVRQFTSGRIILVFGCPGDRDRDKRPIMGEIAAKKADIVIISTDDPHSEDPAKIIDEIAVGVKNVINRGSCVLDHKKIVDRREAIKEALKIARDSDLVLIAGRGHERYQDFAGNKVEIDDREVVKEILSK